MLDWLTARRRMASIQGTSIVTFFSLTDFQFSNCCLYPGYFHCSLINLCWSVFVSLYAWQILGDLCFLEMAEDGQVLGSLCHTNVWQSNLFAPIYGALFPFAALSEYTHLPPNIQESLPHATSCDPPFDQTLLDQTLPLILYGQVMGQNCCYNSWLGLTAPRAQFWHVTACGAPTSPQYCPLSVHCALH